MSQVPGPEVPITVGEPPPVDRAFVEAGDLFAAVVARVPDAAWDAPSPCAGWTVRDVVGHVMETVRKAGALARGESFTRDEGDRPGDLVGDEPLVALASVAGPARAAVDAVEGEPDPELARGLAFPVADLAVHAWDVAHATGEDLVLPDPLLAHVVALCSAVPEEQMRGSAFGPARPAPEGADDTTLLMAWLGRETSR